MDSSPISVPRTPLHDGASIPQVGLGTWAIRDGDAPEVVGRALELGYRHIDTAQMYGNEAGIGRALEASEIPREELFVTTKLDNPHHDPALVRSTLVESLERLRLDRVDLFLIHWPLPSRGLYVDVWRELIAARDAGLAASVGVSNFTPEHLDRIIAETGEVPVVNQVEAHPFFGNRAVREHDRDLGVVTEAWSPIAKGRVAEDPTVRRIAEQVGRTPVQVALRWHVQHDVVVIPKSKDPERMVSNAALFDFELDGEQMAELDGLARLDGLDPGTAGRLGADPAVFAG